MEGNGNYERRIRNLEIWQARVNAELEEGKHAREKYVPIIESLVKEDALQKAVNNVISELANKQWTFRSRLLATATFGILFLSTFVSVYTLIRG